MPKPPFKKLNEQVIVLVGATSGIGLTTARKAARTGARLVLAARNEQALQQICDEVNSRGAEACYVVADVGSEEQVKNIATVAMQRFGGFDTWVNIAGVGVFGRNEEVSIEDMRRLFETNFWGVVYGSLTAVRHLKVHGGALINIGSEVSDCAVPLQGIYSASKHAVKGFTDSLRVELEEQDAPVSVTLIKPAAVDTMFVAHAKNYMEVEPRLPPPIYAPEIVTNGILHAATHPIRDIYIGGVAKLNGAGAYYMPRLLDWYMRRFMFRQHKTNRPAQDREHHSLYTYQDDLLERGGVGGRPHERSLYTSAAMHRGITASVIFGLGLALVALLRGRRNGGREKSMSFQRL
ncbi:MAG TPA: short-chain dehydrogenase [Oxalobacteraceae bacterium]|nr:short-chain dehydrogenase [Oxalobacteraceae bacterium]